MENKFLKLRKELDELGYYQSLHPENLGLVEKLIADLKTTTQSLQKYMKIAQQAMEERDNLELGAEPFKCDNAKLVKECNDLHLAFIHFKEEHEKIEKDLKRQILTFENELQGCESEKQKLTKRVQELEVELVEQGSVLSNLKGKKASIGVVKSNIRSQSTSSLARKKSADKPKNFEFDSAMACADEKIAFLSKEIKMLKDQQLKLVETNELFQIQINNRDKEIKRLTDLLEGGRSIKALNKDCCYKGIDNKVSVLQDELNILKREKNILQNNLKEALAKQHEAMRRALHLAERNKQLEKELKDIDQIALAVEAECNNKVKNNVEKVSRLQDRMNESVIILQNLERDNAKLKQEKHELYSDLEAVKLERQHLQTLLENEMDDKKRMTDRINTFTIIEHDLNMEIDRLVRLSAEQKRKIAELECQITTDKVKAISSDFKGFDIHLELDRLVKLSSEQKQKIADLECQLLTERAKTFRDVRRNQTLMRSSEKELATYDYMEPIQKESHQRARLVVSKDTGTSMKKGVYSSDSDKSPRHGPTKTGPKVQPSKPSMPAPSASPKKSKVHKPTCKKGAKTRRSPVKESAKSLEKTPIVIVDSDDDEPSRGVGSQTIQCCRGCCEDSGCVKRFKELLDKEMEYRQTQALQTIDSLRQEKEYYMKEYHRLLEELKAAPGKLDSNLESLRKEKDYYMKEYHRLIEEMKKPPQKSESYADLIQRLEEKENTIVNLQSENRTLAQEKYGLMTRLESTRDIPEAAELGTKCANALCKRKERESELTKHDLSRLEEENDDLKRRVQALTEKAASDQERIKNAFRELEDHIRKLEDERKELVQGQTSRRTTITRLEEEQDMLREQLRIAQSELIGQKANYNQLKNLHDQTDRALSDTRAQLLQAETELANFQQKMRSTGSQSVLYEKQISALQNDIQIMKGHLNKIEHEKDELLVTVDEKTEKIAMLEEQIKSKSNTISNLQGELAELRRKVGKYGDDSRSQDEILRTTKRELENLRLELENERKNKEAATKENKRLMDDVSSLTCDCKESRKELDLAHRQIEDLKRQLQHYVAEVKRFEDLMDKKELERNELLDQFKSLSQEANILENNNHTLENEASQSRVQLNVALDHASELERKLENQDSIIRSYERQISELTSQVASLEIQLKQCSGQQERFESELKCTRDLCVKLDQDKDNFRRELMNRDEYRAQLDRNLERLRADNEALKSSLSKDRNNVEGLEKLLNDARQEAIDQRLLNQELQAEVNKLKTKVEELQDRLVTASEQVDMYQEKALEYSQQNKQLRREVANERFHRSHDDDNKRYPSL